MSKKATTNNNRNYRFDLMNNTIVFSRKFEAQLNSGDTASRITYLKLQRDFPNMRFNITPKVKRKSKTQITYKAMRKHIADYQNGLVLTTKFEQVCEVAKGKPSPYNFVRDWFMKNFPDYRARFHDLDDEGKIIARALASNDDAQGEEEVCDVSSAPSTNDELEALREPENKVA